MSDAFRDVFPVPVDFSGGEQVSPSKMDGFANQIDLGLQKISEALGDLWSDSYPLFSSSSTPAGGWAYTKSGTNLGSEQRHGQLSNLARMLGPASVLNPRGLTDITASISGETLPQLNGFYLRYIPKSGTLTFSKNGSGEPFETLVGSVDAVNQAGKYYVNYTTGKVTCWADTSSMGTASYDVDVSASYMGDSYEGATFNVIPDPNQSTKCTVTGPVSGKYTIALPTISDQQANWDDTSTTLTQSDDLNYGAQLVLPGYFSSEFSSGSTIPGGLVRLWDKDADAFIEGLTFYYVSQTSIECSDDETLETSSDRYSIVVMGTDICRLLDSVRTKYRKHSHDGMNGELRIKHSDLGGVASGYVTIDGTDIAFTPHSSSTVGNDHPQYLHRSGQDSSLLKNAMLGDLLFASSTTAVDGTPFDGLDDSFGIKWSSPVGSDPYLYYDYSSANLALDNKKLRLNEGMIGDAGGTVGMKSMMLSFIMDLSGGSATEDLSPYIDILSTYELYGYTVIARIDGQTTWHPHANSSSVNDRYDAYIIGSLLQILNAQNNMASADVTVRLVLFYN